jgi:hypothetical protein
MSKNTDDFADFAKPKKKGRGKSKGSAFEREISKQLSLWWSNGQRDDLFWRTAASGGRATVRKKKGKNTGDSGDIASTDPDSAAMTKAFSMELKAGYNTYTLDTLLYRSDQSPLIKFFDQAIQSMRQSEAKNWMVIHKIDRKPLTVYFATATWNGLCAARIARHHHLPYPVFTHVIIPNYQITAMLFVDFLQTFTRSDIEYILNKS